MELERGGLSEGEDCSAPGEDGGFRAYCLGTSSEPWSSGWGVYVCLCDRCIRFPVYSTQVAAAISQTAAHAVRADPTGVYDTRLPSTGTRATLALWPTA